MENPSQYTFERWSIVSVHDRLPTLPCVPSDGFSFRLGLVAISVWPAVLSWLNVLPQACRLVQLLVALLRCLGI